MNLETLIANLIAALDRNTAAHLGKPVTVAETEQPEDEQPGPPASRRGRKPKATRPLAEKVETLEEDEDLPPLTVVKDDNEVESEEDAPEELVAVTHEIIKELVRNYRRENPDKVHLNTADLASVCANFGIKNVSACPDSKLADLYLAVKGIC